MLINDVKSYFYHLILLYNLKTCGNIVNTPLLTINSRLINNLRKLSQQYMPSTHALGPASLRLGHIYQANPSCPCYNLSIYTGIYCIAGF